MVGELWMGVVASVIAHRSVDAVDREELERIGTNEGPPQQKQLSFLAEVG